MFNSCLISNVSVFVVSFISYRAQAKKIKTYGFTNDRCSSVPLLAYKDLLDAIPIGLEYDCHDGCILLTDTISIAGIPTLLKLFS